MQPLNINRPRGITATVLFFGTLKSILIEATPGSPNCTPALYAGCSTEMLHAGRDTRTAPSR